MVPAHAVETGILMAAQDRGSVCEAALIGDGMTVAVLTGLKELVSVRVVAFVDNGVAEGRSPRRWR
jgi:hypothetical protein